MLPHAACFARKSAGMVGGMGERLMAIPIPESHPLRRLFLGLIEQTFVSDLGIGDPKLTDYVADLLVRFVHVDEIWRLHDAAGQRLTEVADMMTAAQQMDRSAKSTREMHRHIGDFTLFWFGTYPEALSQLRAPLTKDHMIDYPQQGKRSYWIASQFDDEPYRDEAPVLRRLSEQFDACAFGLGRVRHEWEKIDPATVGGFRRNIVC
jgi:hypothetical protein